ncbi:MAG TPA: AAA family ATPase [Jatrophihabitantaceae bacterium]|nr:AAA family ATPase [Jatrophihabitantaceae bacterium]
MTICSSSWPVPASIGVQAPQLRRLERSRLDRALSDASAGRSAAVRIVGAPGIGKSSLLDYAVRQARGFRVLRLRASAAERDLPYATLQMLCSAAATEVDSLAPSQRGVLARVVGEAAGPEPDRLAVGVATVALISAMTSSRPLCLVIDDAHWLDHASRQVVGFVAGRMARHSLALLLAEREQPRRADALDAVPPMLLRPLPLLDACSLLTANLPDSIDAMVAERIVAEAAGNPQVIIDSVSGLAPAEFAGGFGAATSAHARRCKDTHDCLARARRLSDEGSRLLIAAAAEPTGDPSLLWRAADRLAVPPEATREVEESALVTFGTSILFACGGLRPTLYAAADPAERRRVHQALADASYADPLIRTWHRSAATTGLDEKLAADLERWAPAAQARAGIGARAAFLERAARFTEDPALRAQRALLAATAMHEAGDADTAHRLLTIAELGPADPARAAHVMWRRAKLADASRPGADSSRALLAAAECLRPVSGASAREAQLDALLAALFAGQDRFRADQAGAITIGRTMLAEHESAPAHPVDQLLYGLATRAVHGYSAAAPLLAAAIDTLCHGELDLRAAARLDLAGAVAADLWDVDAWTVLARRRSALGGSPSETGRCSYQALAALQLGEFDAAQAILTRQAAGLPAGGDVPVQYPALLLAGWTGEHDRLDRLLVQVDRESDTGCTAAALSEAVLNNGLGRYGAALGAARRAAASGQLALSGWALLELVEAAVRSGDPDAAVEAVDAAGRLNRHCAAASTEWARAAAALAQALVSEPAEAEAGYLDAIGFLTRCGLRPQLARTRLLYGEWLRRRNRRVDARAQLRECAAEFAALGARAFAERADRELLATGESARKRTVGTDRQLTPQERRIAYLARDGMSNPEIGGRLYLSARTVEYHLHKVYAKLNISSRTEIHLALAPERDGPGPEHPAQFQPTG